MGRAPRAAPLTATLMLGVLVLGYVALRIVALPDALSETPSFTHDSAYIGIVARNLLEGRGYVNDANWLLFLHPPSLPMFFHNANPLYPTLTAAVMPLAGHDPARAAAIVSILGSALMGAGTFFLLRAFGRGDKLPIACAAAVVLLPANWRISYALMPDALATGLVLCVLAIVAHARRGWHWWVAGAVLGLAWLTRSSSSLIVPPVALWMLWRRGLMPGLKGGMAMGVAVLVVAAPWLGHTARVRGSPLASDASYYWLMDYHASRTGRGADQYFRSLEAPPSSAEVLGREGPEVASFALQGVGITLRHAAAGLAVNSRMAAVVLIAALLAGLLAVPRQALHAEGAVIAGLWLVTIAALAVRGPSSEARYFSVGNTLLVFALLAPFLVELRGWRRWLRVPVIGYGLIVVPWQDVSLARHMLSPDPSLEGFRASALSTARVMPGVTAAVSHLPYMFTYHTGRQAVSPPYPAKDDLLDVMERYRAFFVLLPTDSVGYYYRGGTDSLAPELRVMDREGRFSVLRMDIVN